jgi:hypothetical protein
VPRREDETAVKHHIYHIQVLGSGPLLEPAMWDKQPSQAQHHFNELKAVTPVLASPASTLGSTSHSITDGILPWATSGSYTSTPD